MVFPVLNNTWKARTTQLLHYFTARTSTVQLVNTLVMTTGQVCEWVLCYHILGTSNHREILLSLSSPEKLRHVLAGWHAARSYAGQGHPDSETPVRRLGKNRKTIAESVGAVFFSFWYGLTCHPTFRFIITMWKQWTFLSDNNNKHFKWSFNCMMLRKFEKDMLTSFYKRYRIA